MTTNEHTLKFFGEELQQLKAEVARMGGLVEAQVADCIQAVANRDVALARPWSPATKSSTPCKWRSRRRPSA